MGNIIGVPKNDGFNNKSVELHDSENAWKPRRFKDQNMDDEEVKTVELHDSENAWKPRRFKDQNMDDEEVKTEAFTREVFSALNKLSRPNFTTSVEKIRNLNIDTVEKMNQVVELVFQKAINDPIFCKEYALMCKKLALMKVSGTDPEDTTTTNFRKLIITRCQNEFQKKSEIGELRETKAKKIEECTDPEKKKELILFYEEEERRIRMKSVGNIRFIGELFNFGMLTKKIMLFCINHLLQNQDEENLECLCTLLTTIGKNLDTNKDDLNEYFKRMQNIANDKGPGKISSRVRFMLKDVIDLRANRWVPKEIQKEVKMMRKEMKLQFHVDEKNLTLTLK